MTLRWKVFEESIWARVKQHDARRQMGFWQKVVHYLDFRIMVPHPPSWLGLLLAILFLLALTNIYFESLVAYPELWLAGVGLWEMLLLIGRVELARIPLQAEYHLLWMLPCPVDDIFSYWAKRFIFAGIRVFVSFLIFYGLIAASLPHSQTPWLGVVLCALLQSGLSLGLTFLIIALRLRKKWLGGSAWFCVLCGFICLCCLYPDQAYQISRTLLNWIPMGWCNALFWDGLLQGLSQAWWFLVPILTVLASMPFTLTKVKRLHHRGQFLQVTQVTSRRQIALSDSLSATEEEPVDSNGAIPITDDPGWRPVQWEKLGWLERLLSRFLNSRERALAELLSAHYHGLSAQYGSILLYLALFLSANLLIPFDRLEDIGAALALKQQSVLKALGPLFMAFVIMTMIVAKAFFLLVWPRRPEYSLLSGGNQAQLFQTYRLFPVNYWDTARVVAKINTLLIALLVPPASLISFTPIFHTYIPEFQNNIFLPLKLLLVAWCWSLTMLALGLTIIDFKLKHWWSFIKTFLVCVAFVLLGGFGLCPWPYWQDLAWAIVCVAATLVWFFYCGARYRQGQLV